MSTITKKRIIAALKASVEKWKAIVAGTGYDNGVNDCALCKLFWDEDCVGCPVMEKTERDSCGGTPYAEWIWQAEVNHNGKRVKTLKSRKTAMAELEFLKELLAEHDIRKGWKVMTVTCRKPGQLLSACAPEMVPDTRYVPGEWVKPRKGCGPLCVFEDLDRALAYTRTNLGTAFARIAECEYRPSSEERIWQSRSKYAKNRHFGCAAPLNRLPNGTKLASAVKIGEPREVEYDKQGFGLKIKRKKKA